MSGRGSQHGGTSRYLSERLPAQYSPNVALNAHGAEPAAGASGSRAERMRRSCTRAYHASKKPSTLCA